MRDLTLRMLVALLLVVVSATTLAYLSQTFVVEILAVGVAVAGAYGWTHSLKRTSWLGLLIFVAGIFTAKWFLWPLDARYPFFSLGHAIAEFLLMTQGLLFVLRKQDQPLGATFLPLGVAVLLGAGFVPDISEVQNAFYQGAVVLLVLLSAAWSALGRPVQKEPGRSSFRMIRTILLGLMVLLTGGISVTGSMLLHRHWMAIEKFLNEWIKPHTAGAGDFNLAGFSKRRESPIGSVNFLKSFQADQVALRIAGNGEPGYLRGMAYENYRAGNSGRDAWLAGSDEPRRRLPAKTPLPYISRSEPWEQLFVIRPETSPPDRQFEVWPEAPTEALFTELTTNVVAAPVDAVRVDDHDVVEAADLSHGNSYRLLGADPTDVPNLPTELRQKLLNVPPELQSELAEVQQSIFANRNSPQEKIAAVEEYFDRGFQYNLGITVPPDQNPVKYFLTNKPAAHCEFFATSTVLLLRMAGIPSRYMTGYLAGGEYNRLGGYWIVRNKSAHAWAEAYVDGEGWRVVETTPSEGLSQQASEPRLSHLWDNVFLKLLRIRSLLTQGGGRATLQAFWILLTALFTTIPGLAVTAILSVILFRLLRPLWKRRREVLVVPPEVAALRRLLKRTDRWLSKRQLTRLPGETLHQFAGRLQVAAADETALRPVAEWYRAWATLRYGGEIDAARVAELQRAAAGLGI